MQPVETMAWLPTDAVPLTDAALAYAAHGFRVVAVWSVRPMPDGRCHCGRRDCRGVGSSAGKHPIGNGWQKRATTDADAVRDARRAQPNANIGLAMGGEERLVAVDIDGEKGRASWAEIETNVRPAPVTLTSRSGRSDGGEHRIYRVPPHLDIKRLGNRSGSRWPGVDTRTDNGQIVVAPSLHVSGTRYTWTTRAPIADMPEWLFEALAVPLEQVRPIPPRLAVVPPPASSDPRDGRGAYIRKVIDNASHEIASTKEGGRNSLLFAKACTVFEYHVGEGLDHVGAWRQLAEAGAAAGLKEGEVSSVLSKAWRKAQGSVGRRVPDRAPPSSGALPSPSSPPSDGDGGSGGDGGDGGDGASHWQVTLTTNAEGHIKNTFGNVCKILRNADAYRGRLSFNAMRVAPYIEGRLLRESDLARIREDIEQQWGFAPTKADVVQAVSLVAEERSFHPVQQYLGGLAWDGEARIARVAAEVLGNRTADALTLKMLRLWFISAVARALQPGCKVDTTLVLVGDQSFRKSTFFESLGGEWFSNSYADIKTKDGVLQVHAAWLYEWAEIERITTRTSSSDVKAFLTVSKDDVRPPYAMGVVTQPRSSVIVGSTNKAFLDDETGSRRFWPVKVEQRVDVTRLRGWRDQLWAEAVVAFKTGEEWWLTEEEDRQREHAASEHMVDNPWLERIARYVADPSRLHFGVTVADVLVGALGLELGRIARGDETRVGKALRHLDWTAKQEIRNGARVRVYRPAQHHARVVQGCATETVVNPAPSQPEQPTQQVQRVNREEAEGSTKGFPTALENPRAGCEVVHEEAGVFGAEGEESFSNWLERQP